MSEIVITEKELLIRRNQGTTHICRSCKDSKNKIVLISHQIGGPNEIVYAFCDSCLEALNECVPCKKKTRK